MSAHTPGPWQAHVGQNGDVMTMDGLAIAECCLRYSSIEEPAQLANTVLIAAAPELLEALNQYALAFTDQKEARAEFGDLAVDRELVRRAAIAKATGSPA
jgi:hypothetical protein